LGHRKGARGEILGEENREHSIKARSDMTEKIDNDHLASAHKNTSLQIRRTKKKNPGGMEEKSGLKGRPENSTNVV